MRSWSQSLLLREMIMALICSVPTHLRKEHAGIQFCAKKSRVVVTLLPTHNHNIAHYYPLKLHLGNSIFKDCKSPATSSFAWYRLPPFFPLCLLDPLTLCSFPYHFSSVVCLFSYDPLLSSPSGPLFYPFLLACHPFQTTQSLPNLHTSCLWGHLQLPSTHLRSVSAPSPPLKSNSHVQASNFVWFKRPHQYS